MIMSDAREDKYRKFFDETQDMLLIAEVDSGLITDCNKAVVQTLGWKREELIGRHQRSLHPVHEHEGEFTRTFRQHLKTNSGQTLEAQFITKDGKVLDVAIKAKVFTLDGEKLILAAVRDISSEKQYQREIDNLARFPDENPNPVLRASSSGTTLYINKAGQKMLKACGIATGVPMPDFSQQALATAYHSQDKVIQEFQIDGKTFQFFFTPIPGEDYVNIYAMDITARKQVENDLQRSKQRYHLAQTAAGIGSWEWDIQSGALFWSESVYEIFALEEGSFAGNLDAFKSLIHPDDRERVDQAIQISLGGGEYRIEHRVNRPDGSVLWVRESGRMFFDKEGNPLRMHGIIQDISEEKSTRDKIRILSQTVEHSPVSIVLTDLDGTISYVNPKFTAVSGYTSEEVLGKNPRLLNSGKQSADFYKSMWETINKGGEWRGEFCNLAKDGTEYWESATISTIMDDTGKPGYYVAIKEEITEKKRQAEKIQYLALHDQLTTLYNSGSFCDHLEKAIKAGERSGKELAVLYLDLDGFKAINDTLGHAAGDEVLREVAARLLHSVREMDIVARMGGDEFAIMVSAFSTNKEIEKLADRIIASLNEPLAVGDQECWIGVSIGVSFYPDDDHRPGELIQKADEAMYRVKEKGKNNFAYYSARAA